MAPKKGWGSIFSGIGNIFSAIGTKIGNAVHAKGEKMHGTGLGSYHKGVGEGLREYHRGIGEGYKAEAEGIRFHRGHAERLSGEYKALHHIEDKLEHAKGENVSVKRDDLAGILRLGPNDQADELQNYLTGTRGNIVHVPISVLKDAISSAERYVPHKKKPYHSPLEEIAYGRAAAVILFALALVLLMPLSITGFAIAGNLGNSISYIEFIGVLTLLGALYLFSRRR